MNQSNKSKIHIKWFIEALKKGWNVMFHGSVCGREHPSLYNLSRWVMPEFGDLHCRSMTACSQESGSADVRRGPGIMGSDWIREALRVLVCFCYFTFHHVGCLELVSTLFVATRRPEVSHICTLSGWLTHLERCYRKNICEAGTD